LIPEPYSPIKVDQTAIIRSIFEPLGGNSNMDKKWLCNVLLEFFLILKRTKSNIDVILIFIRGNFNYFSSIISLNSWSWSCLKLKNIPDSNRSFSTEL